MIEKSCGRSCAPQGRILIVTSARYQTGPPRLSSGTLPDDLPVVPPAPLNPGGLRPVMESPGLAILELRGGTHLLLFLARVKQRKGPVRSFDFMVDDVEALRARLATAGLAPNDLRDDARGGHRYFEVSDPDGHVLTVFSNHAAGRPV